MTDEQKVTYVFDQHDMNERLRLKKQSEILDRSIQSLAPVGMDRVRRIVDLACGTGSWCVKVAKSYPDVEIIGIDNDPGILAFGKAQAVKEGARHVSFLEMDITQPLTLPDASFDLVDARLIFGLLRPDMYVSLFRECRRILRPGGTIMITEQITQFVNDSIYMEMMQKFARAFIRVGYFFNTDERWMHSGVVLHMKKLFQEAGFVKLDHMAHLIDFSYGQEAHDPVLINMVAAYEQGRKVLLGTKVVTEEEYTQMQEQIKTYKGKENFLGHWWFATTYGRKPF